MLHKTASFRDLVRLFKLMFIDFASRTAQTRLIQTDDLFTNRVLQDIEKHLHEKLTPTQIAQRLRVSSSYLCQAFKKETGITVSTYINKRKINESKYLLSQRGATITKVAFTLGYSTVNYFSTVFKAITSETPAAYMIRHKEHS